MLIAYTIQACRMTYHWTLPPIIAIVSHHNWPFLSTPFMCLFQSITHLGWMVISPKHYSFALALGYLETTTWYRWESVFISKIVSRNKSDSILKLESVRMWYLSYEYITVNHWKYICPDIDAICLQFSIIHFHFTDSN